MGNKINDPIVRLMGLRYKSHPWHGLDIGTDAPNVVTAFIEMVPTDTVKYELDKVSGYIKIDRPQKYSNVVPALYGFLPQTYCGDLVAEYCMAQTERTDTYNVYFIIGFPKCKVFFQKNKKFSVSFRKF